MVLILGSLAVNAQAASKILVLGDSLSAGYGLDVSQGWVSLLQQKLRTQGLPHQVVNASISGETTAGGLARLPQALKSHKPDVVLIELGANDGLRGLSLKSLRANLEKMVDLSRAAGATPLLFEMRIPSNYGREYTDGFHTTFALVAKEKKVPLVPFFLAPIALREKYFQDDGLHPGSKAQPLMLDAVWPTLEPMLEVK